jgi:hypothetical protein
VLDGAAGTTENGRVMLRAGEFYDIRLEASFTTGGAALHLCWETAELDRRRIEQRFLYPTGTAGTKYPGGLQAHWRCDEGSGTTVADASGGGRTLTLTGGGWTTGGRIGAGLQIAGSGSGSVNLDTSETARTVPLWFKTTADGGLFATADGGSGSDGDLWVAGGRVHARIGTQTITSAGGGLADGAWHHLVHVLGGPEGGQRLYVDGRLVAAGDRSSSSFIGQNRILVGRAPAAPTPGFTGSIDEVRVYDLALSPRAIEDDLYRREIGLIAHFAFDEGAGAIARDLAGTPQVFATLAGNASWTTGRFGKALRFQPRPYTPTLAYTNTEVRVPTTDLTVAFWYRTSSQWAQLAAVDRDSGYNYIIEPIQMYLEQGKPVARILDDQGNGNFTGWPTTVTSDNQWHHLAVTLSSQGGAALYLNGQSVGTLPTVRNLAYSNRFGVDFGGGDADVDIDDGRVYGRALSAAEIAALYASTPVNPVVTPAVPAAPVVSGNGTVAPRVSGAGTRGDQIRILVGGAEVGFVVIGVGGTWSYELGGLNPGSYQVSVTAGNAGGTSAPSPAITVTVGTTVDDTPPATPAAPTVSSQTSATPLVSGTTEAGATVRIFVDGFQLTTVTANGSGAWSWTVAPPLSVGVHALTVQAVDAAGNESGVSPATTLNVAGSNLPPTISVPAAAAAAQLVLP